MKTIKLLSSLNIKDGLLVTNELKKDYQVFLKQGSADGACGPYALLMALIMLGLIDYKDATNLWWIKRSSKFGKMITKMKEHDTLFHKGTNLNHLKELLEYGFKNTLELRVSEETGRNLINFCMEELKQDKPIIIGVNGINLAHWLLAVGYEENSKGEVCKLFFLDSSGYENANYWNVVIDIENTVYGRYAYPWVDSKEERNVSFEHGISIGLK